VQAEAPDYIPPTLWPTNSPYVNSGRLEMKCPAKKVYRYQTHDVNDLCCRIMEDWAYWG